MTNLGLSGNQRVLALSFFRLLSFDQALKAAEQDGTGAYIEVVIDTLIQLACVLSTYNLYTIVEFVNYFIQLELPLISAWILLQCIYPIPTSIICESGNCRINTNISPKFSND